jgi:aerobic carbon-monoxide dehydrogenase medium subunit
VKLPPFAYQRAESLAEATSLLAEYGAEARVLGGGQSLLPLMALRMSRPEVLVDITGAADLTGYAVTADRVVVSAAVTARAAETNPDIRRAHPLLAACLAEVGHVEIRTRGTLCGAVAYADPAAEMPALLLALDGAVRVAGVRRRRRIVAADFLRGPYLTALEEGELVAGVELPCLSPTAGWSVREIARRRGDFALVGVVTVLDADAGGRCTQARIALFGVAGVPVRATEAERALVGEPLSPRLFTEAAGSAFDGVAVLGDLHGSATYRRRAGTRLVQRSLAEAAGRLSAAEAAHA